jgi:ABC-type transport system involved in multi-copper enzyme maturation permease subunit
MNFKSFANTSRQYLPQIRLRNVVFGVLVKEKTRILLMFAYLIANSAAIYLLSTKLIEKSIYQVNVNSTIVLYFRLLVLSSPLIIGLLIGVPLLSTEYESGTYRFLFTQGVGRWRLVRTIFGVYLLFIILFSVMTTIGINHFFTVQQQAGSVSIWSLAVFVSKPIIIIPLTLTTFAAGVLFGTLMKRVILGIVATTLFVLILALGLQASLERALVFFAQRSNGSQENPLLVYYGFVTSNDSKYLFRFQIAFAGVLTILSLVLVFGSLRALYSAGLHRRKPRT